MIYLQLYLKLLRKFNTGFSMNFIGIDLEGVLIPEIWVSLAEKTGINELKLTTKDISDYKELMKIRIDILKKKTNTINFII